MYMYICIILLEVNPILPLLTRTVLVSSVPVVDTSGIVRIWPAQMKASSLFFSLRYINDAEPLMLNDLQPLCGLLAFFKHCCSECNK